MKKYESNYRAIFGLMPYALAVVIILAIIQVLTSCDKEDPGPQMGCQTGMRSGERKLLRCCTREEHLAGNNEAAGGISYFQNYTQHQWEAVSDCKECDKYR